jgi:hypothetical protein
MEQPPTRRSAPWVGWPWELTGAALLSLVVALALAAPCLPEPNLRLLGHPDIDLSAHIWSVWWSTRPDAQALVNTPFHGVEFYVLEPLNLALFRLFLPLFDMVMAHNLVVLVGWMVAGLGGYALGRTVTQSALAGCVGLVLVELSPATVNAVADGTGEFAWTGLLALSLATFIRLVRRPTLLRALVAGLCFALTGIGCFYYGLFAGIAALLWWIARPQRSGRTRWRALVGCALAAGFGTLLLLPFILAFRGAPMDMPNMKQSLFGLPFTPSELVEPDLLFFLAERQAHGPLPRLGWWFLASVLAAGGLLEPSTLRRPALVLGLAGLVMAMGSVGPLGLPLPFVVANRILGQLDGALHQPIHFMTLLILALVVLSCKMVARRPALAVLVVALAVDLHPRLEWLPVPTTILEHSTALRALRTQQGSVLDLPSVMDERQVDLDREAQHQLEHQRPIPRFPVFPTSYVHDQGIRAARATGLVRAVAEGPPWDAQPDTTDLWELGFRWVVLDLEHSAELSIPLQRWLGPPRWQDPGVEVYELQPPSSAGDAP